MGVGFFRHAAISSIRRTASSYTSDFSRAALDTLTVETVAMARASGEDPAAGLPDEMVPPEAIELGLHDPSVAAFLSIHNMCAWMVDRFGDEAQRRARPVVIMRTRPEGPPEEPDTDQQNQYLTPALQRRSAACPGDRSLQDGEAAEHQHDRRSDMGDDQDRTGAKRPE